MDIEEEYDDVSDGIQDMVPDDEIGSIVLLDMETTAPRHSVDDNYLIFICRRKAACHRLVQFTFWNPS